MKNTNTVKYYLCRILQSAVQGMEMITLVQDNGIIASRYKKENQKTTVVN